MNPAAHSRSPAGRFAALALACLFLLFFGAGAAHCADAWQAEFEAICSKTDALDDLPEAEIAALIERCDKLAATLDVENPTARKVTLRRLKNCRDLIQFMLDTKKAQTEDATGK